MVSIHPCALSQWCAEVELSGHFGTSAEVS